MTAGILCVECYDIIVSRHRHDFKYCSCGSTFVDGGTEYIRTSITGRIVEVDE